MGKKLIRATYSLGLIPLFIGLSIFFAWWIGKAWFLVTLHRLEWYGFLWIFISIPLGLVGLLTATIYLFKTTKANLRTGVVGLLCVLINIPALLWVVNKQYDIDQRAYVRIFNHSGIDFTGLTIENSISIGKFRHLSNGEREVAYFYPKYMSEDFDSVPIVDSVRLVIQTENGERVINVVSQIYKGECTGIIVNREFSLEVQ